MAYSDHFRGIAKCNVGDGTSVMLWNDVWNDQILREELPRLHSFAKNNKISVAKYINNHFSKNKKKKYINNQSITDNFHLPMSIEAYHELQVLNDIILQLQQNQQQRDEWHYIWGSKVYTASKFYLIPFLALQPPQPIKWIWKSKCSKKVKTFTWMLFMDRLNTRNILNRKGIPVQGNNYNCGMCQALTEETAFHLFFDCHFSKACWSHIGITWDTSLDFFEMIQEAKRRYAPPNFMEIFIMAAWHIWKQRNRLISDNAPPSLQSWWQDFQTEVKLQVHRANRVTRDNILSWLDSLQAPAP